MYTIFQSRISLINQVSQPKIQQAIFRSISSGIGSGTDKDSIKLNKTKTKHKLVFAVASISLQNHKIRLKSINRY